MRFTRAAVLGTVMAAGMVTAPPPAAGAAEAAQAQVRNAITLITGDRVIVSGPPGKPSYQVEAGAGRRVSFSIGTWGGHTHVIPSDAAALVGKGLVDRRLFDVTQLLEWRYDDASRPDIPIMTQGGAAPKAAEAGRSVATVGLSAARVDKARAATVWQELGRGAGARTLAAGVTKLWLDGRLSYSLEKGVAQIGAPDAWRRGLSGKGVTVAVLDTGYDPAHPDLQGVVTQSANFSDEPDIADNVGHGTHVASIVAGSGQASGGRYRGVAPDAKIAVGKVGGAKGIHESAVIAGMEWAATQAKAAVVNVSLGAYDTEEIDPMEQAVNTLSERTGTLFVVAAGNDSVRGTISSPGSADAALTVGAVDGDDQRASFSSQGPRAGDRAVKPDITAPGVRITAAAAKGAYVAYSGTSMAAPHVAGAAAILAQLHPDWTGAQIKAALMSSARPGAGLTPYEQGVGRVDVARAVTQPVTADPPNLWAQVPWPPTGVPLTEEITYTNASSEPVDLTLTSDGPFALSADRLSVPANGRAAVTLTLPADLKTGAHPGKVTATSGDLTVRSLAGAFVEPEYHTVTLTAIGRTGEPVDAAMSGLYNLETGEYEDLFGFEGGTAKVRVPSGEWHLQAHLFEMSALTTMSKVVHVGSQDEQVTIDAREGRPVRFSLDDPAAQPVGVLQLSTRVTRDGRSAEAGLVVSPGPEQTVYVIPGSYPGLEFMALSAWEKSGTPAIRYDLAD